MRLLERRLANFAIVAAAVTFAFCVSVIAGGGMRRPDTHIAQLGSVAPEIAFRDVNDNDLKLSGMRGSFVLVCFSPELVDPPKSAAATSDAGLSPSPSANAALNSNLNELNQLSDALNAKRVMVLEGVQSPSEMPMKLLGVSINSGSNLASDHSARCSRMLLDSDGEIARNYRVDAIAAQPTLFVIDDRGVIRYRGSFEAASAENLMHKLAAIGSAKQFSTALPSTYVQPLAVLNHF